MGLKRRAFLKQTGLGLVALGLNEVLLAKVAGRYQRVLAQPTHRKLALLIGINQYPENVCDCTPGREGALLGCVTDVELQRELLTARYGFQASDILTLTNQEATRSAIEDAFRSHLINQAKPGDVVVVHFSGLGSQLAVSKVADTPRESHYSLVPVDGVLPTEDKPEINDLLDETLVLLLRSLQTDQVTTVLDTSYTYPDPEVRGSLRVRSRPSTPTGRLSESAHTLQQQLLSLGKATEGQAKVQWKSGQLHGVVLTAAELDQGAIEGNWNGFSAGLFTYALTQQLWWTAPKTTLRVCLSRSSREINRLVGAEQSPLLWGQGARDQSVGPYFLDPSPDMGADGIIKSLSDDGQTVKIWMGGLPNLVLEHYGMNSLLALVPIESSLATTSATPVQTVVAESTEANATDVSRIGTDSPTSEAVSSEAGGDASVSATSPGATNPDATSPDATNLAAKNAQEAKPSEAIASSAETAPPANGTAVSAPILLQVRSRNGLMVKARPCCANPATPYSLKVGQLLQEAVRIIPRNVGLTVALDSSLERVERVDATSAFSAVPRVSAVIAGEQPADYLFGRTQNQDRTLTASLVADASDVDSNPDDNHPSIPVFSRGQYGLFNLGRTVIPGTLTEGNEAVKTAVSRIAPQLQSLLANKLLRLTANRGSSRLGVRATLEMVSPQERIVIQQETIRTPSLLPDGKLAALFVGQGELPDLSVGSRIRYRLQNFSEEPVYFIVLGMDSGGSSFVLEPPAPGSSSSVLAQTAVIGPGETLILPQPLAPSEWIVNPPLGLVETHLIFSRTPLKRTFATVEAALRPREASYRISPMSNALEVAQAILRDLHQSSVPLIPTDVPADSYSLSLDVWATLSFVYRVIAA
jgi:hypothetical protein